MKTTPITVEYANWLGTMEWHYYCTLTTRYSMTIKQARRAMERLFSHLTANYGKVRIFWVAEPFDTKYSYHTHALVHLGNLPKKVMAALLRKAWQIVSKGKGGKENNHTVLKPYDKKLGARFYLSKYMLRKDCEHDIDFTKDYLI